MSASPIDNALTRDRSLSNVTSVTRESLVPLAPPTSVIPSQEIPTSPTPPTARRAPGPISIPPQPHLAGRPPSVITSGPMARAVRLPVSPRKTQRGDPSSSLLEGLTPYKHSWSHPFPSSQVPSEAISPPQRPPRPARPAEALLFDAQEPVSVQQQQTGAVSRPLVQVSPESDSTEFTSLVEAAPGSSVSSLDTAVPSRTRKNSSSHRKPVPRFLTTADVRPTLSISGFEALINAEDISRHRQSRKRGAAVDEIHSRSVRRLEDSEPVFSPRIGLGLAQDGVQARQDRRTRDDNRMSTGLSGRRQGPTHREGGDLGQQSIVRLSGRHLADNDGHRSDGYITVAQDLSRNSSTDSRRQIQLQTPPSTVHHHQRRGSEPLSSHMRKRSVTRSMSKGENGLQEVVVVPSTLADDSDDDGGDDGLPAREVTFRPERMTFDLLEYRGLFPKLLHMFYPLVVLFHFPATIFLDFNVIYMLAQLGAHPAFPSTSVGLVARALISVPTIQSSTGWWVALGIYAGCTFLWFVGVSLLYEAYGGFMRPWAGSGRVPIGRVYRGSASFNYACMASYEKFCFLWRVRLAPFQSESPLTQAVRGTQVSDGIAETFSWYSQNWPTVVLLIPRVGLSLALLLLFGTVAYGNAATGATERDSAFFEPNGTLTAYATGVLLANCAWAALRLLIVCTSALGLFWCNRSTGASSTSSFAPSFHSSRQRLTLPDTPDDLDEKAGHRRPLLRGPDWKRRRNQRLRTAILICLRTSTHTSPAFSPFFGSTPGGHGRSAARRPSETQASVDRDLGADQATWGERYRRTLQSRRNAEENAVEELQGHPARPGDSNTSDRYVIPAPRAHSPLMTFSPEVLRDFSDATRDQYPRKHSGTKLHRRGKSKSASVDADVISPEEDADRLLQAARKHSLPPRPLSVHGLEPDEALRPALKSHFSFIDDGSPQPHLPSSSSAQPQSANDIGYRLTLRKTLSLDRPLPATPFPQTPRDNESSTPPAIELIEPTLTSVNGSPTTATSPASSGNSHSHSRALQSVDLNTLVLSSPDLRPTSTSTLGEVPAAACD